MPKVNAAINVLAFEVTEELHSKLTSNDERCDEGYVEIKTLLEGKLGCKITIEDLEDSTVEE